MDTSSEQPPHSGSRWEPDPSEHPTQVIGGTHEPAAAEPVRKAGMPTALLAAIVIAGSSLFGAAVGFAVATQNNDEQSVSTVDQQTTPGQGAAPGEQTAPGQGLVPDQGDRGFDRDGDGFGHDGDGGYR